jgi:beta-N-acetylhexosaminidase
VALVVGGVWVGIELGRDRHSDPSATAAYPTALPAEVPRTLVTAIGPAAPIPLAAPGCGDAPALLASMSTRDKLAQLLMVGVTGEADARTVVADHHVGGIFIGSWTDLSMLTSGALTAIAGSAGPLPLAVSVDEEGGRVSRLSSLIGLAPSARELAQSGSAEQVYQLALERGRKMRQLGITVDMAPVVDVTDSAPTRSSATGRSVPNPRWSPSTPAPTRAASGQAGYCRCSNTFPDMAMHPATPIPAEWLPHRWMSCKMSI